MIGRTVVAVALAVGLLAVSLPVVERARVDHSTATIAGELERVERTAEALAARNDVVPDDGPPARTRVTLSLPVRSWGDSGVDTVRIPPEVDGPDAVWTAGGGDQRRRTFPDVRLRGAGDGLVLGDGGRQRVVLALREGDAGRTVVVGRPPSAAASAQSRAVAASGRPRVVDRPALPGAPGIPGT